MFPVSTRFERVMIAAPLFDAIEVIEYPAFTVALPLYPVTLSTGTDFARP